MNRAEVWMPGSPSLPRQQPWAAILWLALVAIGGSIISFLPSLPIGAPMQSPGWDHWLGTDLLGRDLAWRLLAGGGRSLVVASVALAVSVVIGGVWGISAGFAGGWIDRLLGRGMDVALSVPSLVLALIILAALGPGETAVMIAVGAGGAATFARLTRAEAAQLRGREFLLAARSLGAGEPYLAARHLLPNIAGPLTAFAVLHFGWALVNAASLTFLGFGGAPSVPEWGRMLNEARLVFWQAPWQAAGPGLALAATVLAVQSCGEWWLEKTRSG
jgi:peptide/nickel transport system permease protein